MYMANAKILCLLPNATYIPLTRVGGFVLGDAKNFATSYAKDTNMLVYLREVTQKYARQIVLCHSGI